MPCSHAAGGGGDEERGERTDEGVARREFMKSALLIGGASALATSGAVVGFSGTAGAAPATAAERDNRQHAWNRFLTDSDTSPAGVDFHVLLCLNYRGAGEPSPADRAEMEGALSQLEEAFEWSDRGLLFTVSYGQPYWDRFDDALPSGARLLDNRASTDAMVKRTPGTYEAFEDPQLEPYDLFVDLASDNVTNILAAEEALWGNCEELEEVEIAHTFEGLFEKPEAYPDRRTGFVGVGVAGDDTEAVRAHEGFGNPNEDIPEDAQLTMGFRSSFEDNANQEENVTLVHDQRFDDGEARPPGQFAQGTVQHLSRLEVDLITWYGDSLTSRRTRMFSPRHDLENTGVTGRKLGDRSDPGGYPMRDDDAESDVARETIDAARAVKEVIESGGEEGLEAAVDEGNVIGHAQKLARARIDHGTRVGDGERCGRLEPLLLRRDFNSLDGTGADLPNADEMAPDERSIPPNSALHFLALMRFNEDMVTTRRAMNEIAFSSPDGSVRHDPVPEVEAELDAHGIQEYILATRRGNFLVPPITLRSLPTPRALDLDIEVSPDPLPAEGYLPVELRSTEDVHVADLDAGTLRFGPRTEVDQGRGATVERVYGDSHGDGLDERIALFRVEEAGFEDGDGVGRLFGKTRDGVAVTAEAAVSVE
ncbi:DUF7405 family protein [Halogeometricum luteum]|uniref:Uncharacterized protein n=1 Tax=Halogeometricum luteum TaxID=2950537 RepID=A0ABU2G0N9_9EURY|nr:hypothetical protein [Halogeometricum sp. S3BR5-2]MDS0294051.1 hypothetical protein [Halogeometricum sp. S3BR5-2]